MAPVVIAVAVAGFVFLNEATDNFFHDLFAKSIGLPLYFPAAPGFPPSGPELSPECISNGKFEEGDTSGNSSDEGIDHDCKMLCGGSRSLDRWEVFAQGPKVPGGTQNCSFPFHDAVCWYPDSNANGVRPPDSHRFLDLTGERPRLPDEYGRVRQTIVEGIEPGKIYELSFYIGTDSRTPPWPPAAAGSDDPVYRMDVDLVGSREPSFQPQAGKTPDVSHWTREAFRFRANATTLTLTFTGNGNGTGIPSEQNLTGQYLGLANVSLKKVCLFGGLLFGLC